MKKRLFALVLCLAMVFTFVPTLAFAEDTVIDTVPITIADPVAGEYPTYMSDMLEGKNYTVYQEGWINNSNGYELKAKETFELGIEYIYYVWLKPNGGYSFDYNAAINIENPNWTNIHSFVSSEGYVFFQGYYSVTTGENKVVPDEDKIKETLNLDLGAYNSEPGEFPTIINNTIDCDRYYVLYEDWYDVAARNHMTALDETVIVTDAFEKGKLYIYTLEIKPYDEYGFTDDSQVTIDGIEWNFSSSFIADDGCFIFTGYYTSGLEPIDNVTLNIEEAEAGKPLVFVNTIPEDANYTIYSQEWSKEYEEKIPQDSTYDEMETYDYIIFLKPNDGYRFTINTTGTVNGIEWNYKDFFPCDEELFGDCKYGVFYGKYTVSEKETEATTETTTEATTEVTPEVTTETTTTEATTELTTEAATEATTVEVTTEATTAEVTAEVTTAASIDTPETGNNTKAVLWISLLCVAAAGAFITVMAVRARKQ